MYYLLPNICYSRIRFSKHIFISDIDTISAAYRINQNIRANMLVLPRKTFFWTNKSAWIWLRRAHTQEECLNQCNRARERERDTFQVCHRQIGWWCLSAPTLFECCLAKIVKHKNESKMIVISWTSRLLLVLAYSMLYNINLNYKFDPPP